jgi:threonine dehydrogenase-like Zn-dependent dehydrogenase
MWLQFLEVGIGNVRRVGSLIALCLQQMDVVLRVTTSCICGSDLHMYMGAMPGMKSGDVVGHEFMGIVEAVGPEVEDIIPGK